MNAEKKKDGAALPDLNGGMHHLSPIIMNHRRFINADKVVYRIYTSPSQFTLVEADSAHEAYTKSGLSRAHKIERDAYTNYADLSSEQLSPKDRQVETDVHLPDADELRTLLIAALGDDIISHKPDFEEMAIGELQKADPQMTDAAQEVSVTDEIMQPPHTMQGSAADMQAMQYDAANMAVEITPEATVEAAALLVEAAVVAEPEEEPREKMDHVLSPEEVEALLNS